MPEVMKYLFPDATGWNTRIEHANAMKTMFENIVSEHEAEFDHGSASKDFIEVYLKQMDSDQFFNRQDLIGLCMDFFEAGGETVGSTLSWVVLYFALYPEVQKK